MQDGQSDSPSLKRSLTPIEVILLAFSALSPAFSVYIGGDVTLHLAGSGAALGFLLGGVIAAVLGLLYAEIAAAFPGAGGIYPSLAALLGPLTAFPYIVLVAPIACAQCAIAALGMADYMQVLFPGLPYMPVAIGGTAAAAGIALLNVRFGAVVTGVFLTIEVIALSILTGVAVLHPARGLMELCAHPVRFDAATGSLVPVGAVTLGLGILGGMYNCGGASWGMYFAEEMHGSRRTIGRVVAWTGLLAAITIAAPMILMLMSAPDLKTVLAADAPMAAFLKARGGPTISLVVSAGVALAVFNSLVACMMAYARYVYATGRDGIWPPAVNRVLSWLPPRVGSPVAATLILATATAAMATLGEDRILVLLSGNVSDYILVALAVLIGRAHGRTGRNFKAPLHPSVPVFTLLVAGAAVIADMMDAKAGRPSVLLLIGLFAAGLVYYHFRLRQTSQSWLINREAEHITAELGKG